MHDNAIPKKGIYFSSTNTHLVLSASEKEALVHLLDQDSPAKEKHFSWRQVAMALTDWKMYAVGSIQLCSATCMYSFSLFLPSIIVGMGYNNIHAQLMSAPPYAVGNAWCLHPQ